MREGTISASVTAQTRKRNKDLWRERDQISMALRPEDTTAIHQISDGKVIDLAQHALHDVACRKEFHHLAILAHHSIPTNFRLISLSHMRRSIDPPNSTPERSREGFAQARKHGFHLTVF